MLEQVAWTRKWPSRSAAADCGHPQLRSPAGGTALRFFLPQRTCDCGTRNRRRSCAAIFLTAAEFRNSAAIERSDFASGRSGHPQRFALKLKSTQAALPAGAAPIASAGALHVFLPLAAPSGDG